VSLNHHQAAHQRRTPSGKVVPVRGHGNQMPPVADPPAAVSIDAPTDAGRETRVEVNSAAYDGLLRARDRVAAYASYVSGCEQSWASITENASCDEFDVIVEQTGGGVMCLRMVPTDPVLERATNRYDTYIGSVCSEPEADLAANGEGITAMIYDYETGGQVWRGPFWDGGTMDELGTYVKSTASDMYTAFAAHLATRT
jgi:hypothetical protein